MAGGVGFFRLSSRPSHILVKAGEAGGEIYVVWHSWKMGVWALLTGNEVYRRSFCGETESSGQEEGFQKYARFS